MYSVAFKWPGLFSEQKIQRTLFEGWGDENDTTIKHYILNEKTKEMD